MEGRRRRLQIINRPWFHRFHQFQRQRVLIILVVVISVAIGVWDLKHEGLTPSATESSGTAGETMKKFMEQDIFYNNMEKRRSASLSVWPNHIDLLLHSTCLFLFPAFALTMVGPRNLKLFLRLMAESFGGIYKRTNYIVHGVNLFLLFAFIIIVYAYLVMLYMVCAGFLEIYIGFSVAEVSHSDHQDMMQNRIKYMYFQEDVAPYFTASLKRYDMEDVVMTCSLLVACERNIPTIFNSFRWIKDGKRVVEKTDKINMITNAYKWVEDSSPCCDNFLIETKLAVEVVNSSDYGKYSCEYTHPKLAKGFLIPMEPIPGFEGMHSSYPIDGFIPYSLSKQIVGQKRLGDVTTEIFANYYIRKQMMPPLEVNILPGGIFIEYVPYWSLADPGDIIINETVWDEDCCGLPLWFYKFFYGYRNLVSRSKIGLGHQRFLLRQQCICEKDFALNYFSFTRARYNSTSKSKQVIQVKYPQHFNLALGLPGGYKITPEMDITLPFFTTGVVLKYGMVFFLAVLIIIIFVLRLCLKCVLEYMWIPLISSLKDSFLAEHLRQGYAYDLYFIFYDENDRYEMVLTQELKERLDGTACRVFDVEPGTFSLHERQRAIENSRFFCVIISEESANDGEKILEFTAIKQTLADRKTAGTETEDCKFVIQIGDCDSDGFLIPGNVVVSEYSRDNSELDDSVLRSFSKWARRITKKVSFWQLMKSHGFSIKHSVIVTITTFVFVTCVFYASAFELYEIRCAENERRRMFYEAEE